MENVISFLHELNNARRKHKQQSKTNNLKYLKHFNVPYKQSTEYLCIIKFKGQTIQFYPSTGLWAITNIAKKVYIKHYGIHSLLIYLGYLNQEDELPPIEELLCD